METAIAEDRLTDSPSQEVILPVEVIEALEDLYQMIHSKLVTTLNVTNEHGLSLDGHLNSVEIDTIADTADALIEHLEDAAVFVETVEKEDMANASFFSLLALLISESKKQLSRWCKGGKYLQMMDHVRNKFSAHHELRMKFLRTLLLMANKRRGQLKQPMTDGE